MFRDECLGTVLGFGVILMAGFRSMAEFQLQVIVVVVNQDHQNTQDGRFARCAQTILAGDASNTIDSCSHIPRDILAHSTPGVGPSLSFGCSIE